jgi:hypothetical protein
MKIVLLQIVKSVSFIHRIKIALHPSSIHDDVAFICYHYDASISRGKHQTDRFVLNLPKLELVRVGCFDGR